MTNEFISLKLKYTENFENYRASDIRSNDTHQFSQIKRYTSDDSCVPSNLFLTYDTKKLM